jgi:hypothetical protein
MEVALCTFVLPVAADMVADNLGKEPLAVI